MIKYVNEKFKILFTLFILIVILLILELIPVFFISILLIN